MGWCDWFTDLFEDESPHVDNYNSYTYDDFHSEDDFREETDLYPLYRDNDDDDSRSKINNQN